MRHAPEPRSGPSAQIGTRASEEHWAPQIGGKEPLWSLRRTDVGFDLRGPAGVTAHIPIAQAGRIHIRRHWWRTVVTVETDPNTPPVRLTGLTHAQVRSLEAAVADALALAAAGWRREVDATIALAWRQRRWIPEEAVAALVATRPAVDDAHQPRRGAVDGDATSLSASQLQAWVTTVNDEIAERCRQADRAFLDSIESSPLTDEQARAVVAYDNRVHVIAAAGSGKTSVMVGPRRVRRAPRLHRARSGSCCSRSTETPPMSCATASSAGSPLPASRQACMPRRSTPSAWRSSAHATGRKPTPAPWVVNGQDAEVIADIVDAAARPGSRRSRYQWDLFRLLYARTGDSPAAVVEADAWDRERGLSGLANLRRRRRAQRRRTAPRGLAVPAPRPLRVRAALRGTRPPTRSTGSTTRTSTTPASTCGTSTGALDAHGNPPPKLDGLPKSHARGSGTCTASTAPR